MAPACTVLVLVPVLAPTELQGKSETDYFFKLFSKKYKNGEKIYNFNKRITGT
jgi:hypothetical protein